MTSGVQLDLPFAAPDAADGFTTCGKVLAPAWTLQSQLKRVKVLFERQTFPPLSAAVPLLAPESFQRCADDSVHNDQIRMIKHVFFIFLSSGSRKTANPEGENIKPLPPAVRVSHCEPCCTRRSINYFISIHVFLLSFCPPSVPAWRARGPSRNLVKKKKIRIKKTKKTAALSRKLKHKKNISILQSGRRKKKKCAGDVSSLRKQEVGFVYTLIVFCGLDAIESLSCRPLAVKQ